MPRYGMVIDLGRCIGCKTCAVACSTFNSNVPRRKWWQRVVTVGSKEHMVPTGSYPNVNDTVFLPIPCMHCDNPPCVKVCPVGATWKREDGLVLVDFERCIGCRYCMVACPYGVRRFNWEEEEDSMEKVFGAVRAEAKGYKVPGYDYGYPFEHRTGGRLVYTPRRPRGVVEKCTFCVQRVDEGLIPMCVVACPGNARLFGDLDDPDSEVSKLVRSGGAIRFLEELGTEPKVYYVPPRRRVTRGAVKYEKALAEVK